MAQRTITLRFTPRPDSLVVCGAPRSGSGSSSRPSRGCSTSAARGRCSGTRTTSSGARRMSARSSGRRRPRCARVTGSSSPEFGPCPARPSGCPTSRSSCRRLAAHAPAGGAGPASPPGSRRHHAGIGTIVSILHGRAFVLGEAGLPFDGRRAMTHWLYLRELQGTVPRRPRVVEEGIFVRDGRVWTSAGLTAGIDLTLALVEEDHGARRRDGRREAARVVPPPLGPSRAQFSSALQRQEKEPAKLRDISAFVLEHVGTRRCPSNASPRASA